MPKIEIQHYTNYDNNGSNSKVSSLKCCLLYTANFLWCEKASAETCENIIYFVNSIRALYL